jgi:hypothetical protein
MSAFFAFGTFASGLAAVSIINAGGPLDSIWRLNPRAHAAFLGIGTWSVLLLGVVAIACAAAALGLLYGKRWGYALAITLLIVNCLGDVMNVLMGAEPRAIVGVPVVALLLWYLLSQQVRTYFSSASGQETPHNNRWRVP